MNTDSAKHSEVLKTIYDGDGVPIPCFTEIDGILYPAFPGITSRIREANAFEAHEDDVWIVGYPKSGCHWTYDIVKMLLAGNAENVQTHKNETFYEAVPLSSLTKQQRPRVMNTHLTVERTPRDVFEKKCKIILNIRNPKDVAVSYFHHTKVLAPMNYDGRFKGFLDMFMYGPGPFFSWWQVTLGWYNYAKTHPEVLALKYEDMKLDLPAAVQAMASHIGCPLSEELCREIVHQCDFGVMKERKQETERILPFKTADGTFYRKGVVSDWKTWFTVAQNEEFDKVFQEKMKGSDLDIDFEL